MIVGVRVLDNPEEENIMSKVWPWLISISIIIGIIGGKVQEMTTCIFDSAKSTIETCISILGVICLWNGLMKIADKSGLLHKLQKIFYPLHKILFPDIKADSPATGSIAMNMTGNMIGLGNIATPMGIKAMNELQKENRNKEKLSRSMMTLLVLNMSSIQLIPTTVIALRATNGSSNPAEIVLPVLIASFTSVFVGIILVRILYKE